MKNPLAFGVMMFAASGLFLEAPLAIPAQGRDHGPFL